jgi:predicted RNA binding protein YcfA (HicA-like mRNA interferase family)
VKRNDFINILKDKGVVFFKHGSKHDIFIHKDTGKKIPIPRHVEIKNTTVSEILKEIPNK